MFLVDNLDDSCEQDKLETIGMERKVPRESEKLVAKASLRDTGNTKYLRLGFFLVPT